MKVAEEMIRVQGGLKKLHKDTQSLHIMDQSSAVSPEEKEQMITKQRESAQLRESAYKTIPRAKPSEESSSDLSCPICYRHLEPRLVQNNHHENIPM